MVKEMYEHLTGKIIPFWTGLRDNENGGYYGYVDYDLNVDKKAVKGCILNSRILWFFSNAYMLVKDTEDAEPGLAEKLLGEAEHAYDFMNKYCIDKENGGVFWAVNYDGTVADDIKHTYNQAFSIYALASFYAATGKEEALRTAFDLFDIIEGKCTDNVGYLEAFNRDFTPAENDKLSENGVMAEKTMNTLLHVFEAYTELYKVTGDRRVADRLRFMLDVVADKIYNPALRRQEVFFDALYNSILDLHSYGHDIETAWLIDRGCEVLGDEAYSEKMAPITDVLADRILERAYVNHSLLNECEKGVDNTHRIWWVQAETVVGFVNAWQKHPEREDFRQAALDTWEFIKEHVVDPREGSEWFWEVDGNGDAYPDRPIVEPWKCPYHNGRMCMEIIKRLSNKHA